MSIMRLRLLALALLSCVLFPLALPNELFLDGNPFLGMFCLAFLFWALYESPSYRFAALLGALFGAATCLLSNIWLKNFNEYAMYTLGGTCLAYMGLNALLGVFIHGFSNRAVGQRPFVTAAVFALYEYLKSCGFLAFPYSLLSQPVHSILPFVQFVDITGQWGLSYLCALFSSLLAEGFFFRFNFSLGRGGVWNDLRRVLYRRVANLRWKALSVLALTAVVFCYGAMRMAVGFPSNKSFLALLIQQNIDPWRRNQAAQGLETAAALTVRGLNESIEKYGRLPDIVVWSETALRYPVDVDKTHPFRDDPYYKTRYPDLFENFGTTTLTGAPVVIPRSHHYYNAAILITRDGRVPQFYAKQHPVPFVESIPFMEIKPIRDFFERDLGLANVFTVGTSPVTLRLPLADGRTVGLGTPICFEDVYSDICRGMVLDGAEALVNITNDSWSGMDSALTQHTAAAQYRAIETRTPLLRSTNAGLTCVIDATGAILSGPPLFKPGYLLTDVPVRSDATTTLYTIAGDYFPYILLVALMCLLLSNAYGETVRRKVIQIIVSRKNKAGEKS
ncbi:MAG: apolipoprotein N-acyltransferase [Spirochaetales bacterium]|nr:apolipoprotein N-acyltransferase [Spirochaetales bacterium]